MPSTGACWSTCTRSSEAGLGYRSLLTFAADRRWNLLLGAVPLHQQPSGLLIHPAAVPHTSQGGRPFGACCSGVPPAAWAGAAGGCWGNGLAAGRAALRWVVVVPSDYAMGLAHAGWESMGICLTAWRAAGGRVCRLVHGSAFCAGCPCWLACSHLAAALSTAHTNLQTLSLPAACLQPRIRGTPERWLPSVKRLLPLPPALPSAATSGRPPRGSSDSGASVHANAQSCIAHTYEPQPTILFQSLTLTFTDGSARCTSFLTFD